MAGAAAFVSGNVLKEKGLDSARLYSMERLAPTEYQIFKANVIKNSLNKADNYITLDRGTTEGIRPEMGVVDANGVVGIVYKTSPHYSLVIPLLNSKSSISCKIVGSDYFGYLKWEGGNSPFCLSEGFAPACRIQSGRYSSDQRLFHRVSRRCHGGDGG